MIRNGYQAANCVLQFNNGHTYGARKNAMNGMFYKHKCLFAQIMKKKEKKKNKKDNNKLMSMAVLFSGL